MPLGQPPPGSLLGDRYQLEYLVSTRGVAPLWRAQDRVLDRPVAVRVLNGGPCQQPACRHDSGGCPPDEAASRFLEAATRASRLVHPALARTFDAARDQLPGLGTVTYLVGTWVDGVSLATLLTEGPLAPGRAAGLVAAAAEGVAAAHAAGLPHGGLHPGNVLVGMGDRVTLTDAGLSSRAGQPEPSFGADTTALCGLLYAAVTARWPLADPSPEWVGLPPAPRELGRPAAPRQVRAGIPRSLDSWAMAGLAPTGAAPLPPAALAIGLAGLAAQTAGTEQAAAVPLPPRQPRRGRLAGAVGAGGMALLGIVAVSALALTAGRHSPRQPPAFRRTPTALPAAAVRSLPVQSAHSFDPPPGDGIEQEALVPLAFDGNPATAWRTETYTTARLGNLKSGVGIRIDLGRPTAVGTVTLTFLQAGQGVQLRAGNALVNSAAAYRVLANVPRAGRSLVLHPQARARYWVIWLTRLPPVRGGYQGDVAEVHFAS